MYPRGARRAAGCLVAGATVPGGRAVVVAPAGTPMERLVGMRAEVETGAGWAASRAVAPRAVGRPGVMQGGCWRWVEVLTVAGVAAAVHNRMSV